MLANLLTGKEGYKSVNVGFSDVPERGQFLSRGIVCLRLMSRNHLLSTFEADSSAFKKVAVSTVFINRRKELAIRAELYII